MFKFKNYLLLLFLIIGVGYILINVKAQAASLDNITFPVAELGNCGSKAACEAYCSKSENMLACIEFAEKYEMISKAEADKGRKMAQLGINNGPGGCRSESECENYCNDDSHLAECIEFGKQNGLMSAEEIKEAEMVLRALNKGVPMPGGCKGKAACEAYCDNPDNVIECIAFAEAAGFISAKEAAMVRKTGGKGPGNCRGKAACDVYCNNPANMAVCMEFALEYGLVPPGEMAEMQATLRAIKSGAKMPNCRSKSECDVYCQQPEHMTECFDFALAAGFIDPAEAEEARRMMELGITTGPGGCQSKKECDKFCDNPDNMEACLDFAVKTGMMSAEDAEQAKKMGAMGLTSGPGGCKDEKECDAFCQNPDNMRACIEFSVQAGMMSPEDAERALRMSEQGMRGGPGGCKSEAECNAFCQNPANTNACIDFMVQIGEISPEEAEMMKRGMGGQNRNRGQEQMPPSSE